MGAELLLLSLGLGLIAIIANALSAFAGGGAGLVQLPALILLGLPFASALATHKFGGRASDSVLEGSSESVFDRMPGADGAGADQAPAGN